MKWEVQNFKTFHLTHKHMMFKCLEFSWKYQLPMILLSTDKFSPRCLASIRIIDVIICNWAMDLCWVIGKKWPFVIAPILYQENNLSVLHYFILYFLFSTDHHQQLTSTVKFPANKTTNRRAILSPQMAQNQMICSHDSTPNITCQFCRSAPFLSPHSRLHSLALYIVQQHVLPQSIVNGQSLDCYTV